MIAFFPPLRCSFLTWLVIIGIIFVKHLYSRWDKLPCCLHDCWITGRQLQCFNNFYEDSFNFYYGRWKLLLLCDNIFPDGKFKIAFYILKHIDSRTMICILKRTHHGRRKPEAARQICLTADSWKTVVMIRYSEIALMLCSHKQLQGWRKYVLPCI